MRLLVTGDWHYRSQPPRARTDDFQAALEAKIKEVFEIAAREDCEAIVVPGDISDSPALAYSTLTRLELLLRAGGRQVWAVPGNHDEFAGSLESLDRTVYGHLTVTGAIRDLAESPAETDTVLVEGTGYSTATDAGPEDYLTRHKRKNSVIVHVAHGMLLERPPGFELRHTLLADVAMHPDCPDVLICGHEHLGFGVKRLPRAKGGELVAINPGSLARLSAHPGEIERPVQVCLLEIYPGVPQPCSNCEASLPAEIVKEAVIKCPHCKTLNVWDESCYGPPEVWSIGEPVIDATLIPLASARPGHEVLSRDHLEAVADREAKMAEFLGLLAREGESRFLDVQAIIEGIARCESLPRDVVDEALSRIARAREALGVRG